MHSHYVATPTLARRLDVEDRTVRRWCSSGRLDAFKTPGGHWRVRVDDFGRPCRAG